MIRGRRPPRLLTRTLTVTFVTVALLLAVVFVVVTLTVRAEVRQAVVASLESSQRTFAALEARRQRELRAQAATIADSPTLNAALDTIQVEARAHATTANSEAIETVDRELQKVAARVEADAIVLADGRGTIIDTAGRLGARWQRGRPMSIINADRDTTDGITRSGDMLFRVVAAPLELPDAAIGTLYLATVLDRPFAAELSRLSGARIAIVSDGQLSATTLPERAARQFEASVAVPRPLDGAIVLDGESFAFRRLVVVGDTVFYALSSIDESSVSAMRGAMKSLTVLGGAALALALLASFVLARLLTEPIGQLSHSLATMAGERGVVARLTPTGSSREVDALTETFNALMDSVTRAEAQTEAAYTGAIRALAAALDARDPYTAGHSERVSVLSVAIGRSLALSDDDLEVLRLGALLHDIGKIGVPDQILMKPGTLSDSEVAIIRQHPVLGARILRTVPFLARHIPIVELHHERPDGLGYPLGLRGDDIPLAARIVHVADAYDAITSARAYRHARPPSAALRELWRCAGTHFHADIVGALANALPGLTSAAAPPELEHVS